MVSTTRIISYALLALICLTLFNSCAVLEKHIRPPQVSVADVRLVNMSLTDVQLAFDLTVTNPNPLGISTQGLSYRLDVQDRSLFEGTLTERLKVKANGKSVVTLPFTLRFKEVVGSLRALTDRKAIRYRLSGDVDLGFLKVPYSKSGSFRLSK